MVKSGMGDRDWRPFVYGGLASCVAEFGKPQKKNDFLKVVLFTVFSFDLARLLVLEY